MSRERTTVGFTLSGMGRTSGLSFIRGVLGMAVAAVLCGAPAQAAGVTISGYIDAGYIAAEGGVNNGLTLQASGATNGNLSINDGFALNDVNIDLAGDLRDDISYYASFNFVTGAAPSIDAAYLEFKNPGPFDLKLQAGRIFSIMGIEPRVAESNISKFVNLSLLSPILVGSQDGVAVMGSFSPIDYAFAVTNEDNIGGSALSGVGNGSISDSTYLRPGIYGMTGASANSNNALTLSGRLGVKPLEGLELGITGAKSDLAVPGTAASRDRTTVGADASFVYGAFSLSGEWVKVTEDGLATGQPKTEMKGFYAALGYDINKSWWIGARYAEMNQYQLNNVAAQNDVRTISLAGAYTISDNVILRAEYDFNDESVYNGVSGGAAEIPNDVFALSLVGSF
ncbi:MAG: porin [Candidatus Hydrogenedentota bacterium]|nr:MAG: porin [Candidatus Hydrogenedentota bacterium]